MVAIKEVVNSPVVAKAEPIQESAKTQSSTASCAGVASLRSTIASAAPQQTEAGEKVVGESLIAKIANRVYSAVVAVVTFPFKALKAVFIDFPLYVIRTPARRAEKVAADKAAAEKAAADKVAAEKAAADKAAADKAAADKAAADKAAAYNKTWTGWFKNLFSGAKS